MAICRPIMEEMPLAWAYFVSYILIGVFAISNLLVAVIIQATMDTTRKVAELKRHTVLKAREYTEMKMRRDLLALDENGDGLAARHVVIQYLRAIHVAYEEVRLWAREGGGWRGKRGSKKEGER